MVCAFPSPVDRDVIRTAVNTLLQTQRAAVRTIMLKTIRAVLDRYKIKKIPVDDYIVRKTKEPGWAYVMGKREVAGRKCPGCGADIYKWPGPVKILSISEGYKKDRVSYGCCCGKIFYKMEVI